MSTSTLPAYKRPFTADEFRGYFTWTGDTSKLFKNRWVNHACHQEELRRYLKSGKLLLRSEWAMDVPGHAAQELQGRLGRAQRLFLEPVRPVLHPVPLVRAEGKAVHGVSPEGRPEAVLLSPERERHPDLPSTRAIPSTRPTWICMSKLGQHDGLGPGPHVAAVARQGAGFGPSTTKSVSPTSARGRSRPPARRPWTS